MCDSDQIAVVTAGMLVLTNIITYYFSRREMYNKAFDVGWKMCEKFMIKEILKPDGPEVVGLRL